MATDLPALFGDLVRLETELWNRVDARLREEHELPLAWFEPLRIVDGRAGCRVQDIAAELAITVGGTSKLVDRLEAAGHLRRRANPEDRRSSVLELTAGGRRLLRRAGRTFEAELAEHLVLPAADLEALAASLARLRAGLRS